MANTPLDDEISQRIDYFNDWVKKLSDEREERMVVNERTATDFIKNALSKDASLANLADAMEETGKGFKTFIASDYIQGLISSNKLDTRLSAGVARLREKRQSLEQMIPKRKTVVRRKVINRFTTITTLNKYGIKKDSVGRYRDLRTGRYVSFDRILKITDVVILNTAAKRRDLEKFMKGLKK